MVLNRLEHQKMESVSAEDGVLGESLGESCSLTKRMTMIGCQLPPPSQPVSMVTSDFEDSSGLREG